MSNQTIENNFTYHALSQDKIDVTNCIRLNAKDLALSIDEVCPNSREKSLAMTKLEEAVMWANASVARN